MASLIITIVLALAFSAFFCWCMCAFAGEVDRTEEEYNAKRKINDRKEKE